MLNILLICGHGDGDPGAYSDGYIEADLTREFARLVRDELANYNCNCDIAPDGRNYYTYLKQHGFNFKTYNYVLEIHFNAGGGIGTEIFTRPTVKNQAVETNILNYISQYSGTARRGVKTANFYVIGKVNAQGVPASLLEVCFIDNKNDMIMYETNKKEMAYGVAAGLAKSFNFTKKENTKAMEERIDKINARLTELEQRLAIYNYIDSNMSSTYKPTIQKLVDKGFLKGDENGLALTDDMMRILTVLDRAGVFDE